MADDSVYELADTAYRSKNYEKAYEYYSRILEDDPDNGEAWARKGVAAGGQWSLEDNRREELSVCLEKAQEKGFDLRDEDIADRILDLSQDFIEEVYSYFDSKIEDKRKESMGTGTLESVKEMNVTAEGFVQGGKLASEWIEAIEAMQYACRLAPSTDRYRTTIKEIDKLRAHSKEFNGYLQNNDDAEGCYGHLKSIRSDLIKEAKDLDPDFQPDKVKIGGGTSAGGCYVATATVGSSAPHILDTLRQFRDTYLVPNTVGRSLVVGYYTAGPYLARVIKQNKWLQRASFYLLIWPLYKIISLLTPHDST